MLSDDGRSLWIDPEIRRYFLVPDEQDLPPGDLLIRNVFGRPRSVDAAALAPFEIPKAEADERVRGRIKGALEQGKKAVAELLEQRGQEPPPPPDQATARLRQDVAAFAAGLKELVSGLQRALEEST